MGDGGQGLPFSVLYLAVAFEYCPDTSLQQGEVGGVEEELIRQGGKQNPMPELSALREQLTGSYFRPRTVGTGPRAPF